MSKWFLTREEDIAFNKKLIRTIKEVRRREGGSLDLEIEEIPTGKTHGNNGKYITTIVSPTIFLGEGKKYAVQK